MSKHTSSLSEGVLKKHLKDDAFISEVYQDIPSPEPSSHLDQAILAAAGKHLRSPSWWRQPSSWAATMVIFSLVGLLTFHTLEQEKDTASSLPPVYSPAPVSAVISANKSDKQSDKSSEQVVSKVNFATDAVSTAVPLKEKTQHSSQPAPQPQAAEFRARSAFKASALKTMHKNDTRQPDFSRQPMASEASIAEQTITAQPAPAFSSALSAEQLLKQIQQLIQSKDFKQAALLLQQLQNNYPQQPIDPVILKQLAPWQRTTKP